MAKNLVRFAQGKDSIFKNGDSKRKHSFWWGSGRRPELLFLFENKGIKQKIRAASG